MSAPARRSAAVSLTARAAAVAVAATVVGTALLAGACAGPQLSGAAVGPAAASRAPATTASSRPVEVETAAPAVSASRAGHIAVPVARTRTATPPSPRISFPPLDRDLFDWIPAVPRVDDIGHVRALEGSAGHWTIRFDRVGLVRCQGAVEDGCNHSGGRLVDDSSRLRTYVLSPDVRIVDRSDPRQQDGEVLDPATWFQRARGDRQLVVDLTVTDQGVVTAADIPFTS